jgi:predicted lipoprotein
MARSVRRGIAIVLVAAGAVALGACGGEHTPTASSAFCTAADRYNNELVKEQTKGTIDVAAQIRRVSELARTAPARIRHDAQVFLDALKRVQTDPSVKRDPAVKHSVDNVNRLANQACHVYDNTQSGGF